MKRKKEEIDVYIEQVAAKEKDGEYDTRDICGQKFKQEFQNKRMQTAQEAGKFEIHQLLFKGQPTGYARCSSQKCRDAMWMKKKIVWKKKKIVPGELSDWYEVKGTKLLIEFMSDWDYSYWGYKMKVECLPVGSSSE